MAPTMYLDVFNDNPFATNCWLLSAEGNEEAVIIDPGFSPEEVHGLLERAGKRPAAVLLTHAHIDHAGTAGAFAGDDVPVYVHERDATAFSDPAAWNGGYAQVPEAVKDLRLLTGGESLELAGLSLSVSHTPGHTPGHCMFVNEDLVLSGDLVMAGTIGRFDSPNSDASDMRASLQRFLALSDELGVLPGHGPTTTVGRERASNPFLLELA
jgi:hydroxyacylglutathione hydrolase